MLRYLPFAISVKFWASRRPSVDAARPARCPCCGAAGRDASGKLGIYGHGLRLRMLLGVLDEQHSQGDIHEVSLRRFLCLSCKAVLVVGPWDLLAGKLYTLVTIILALARWAAGESKSTVRQRLGAYRIVGVAALGSWASLRRWAQAAAGGQLLPGAATQLAGSLRKRAQRSIHNLARAGPPDAPLAVRALAGAEHFR